MGKAPWPRYRSRCYKNREEKINKSLTCGFCQGSVELVENLRTWSTSIFQCQNKSCPSHETNLALPTTKKSRVFAINCASVLGFQAIDGGHATASNVLSFLNLYTWNENLNYITSDNSDSYPTGKYSVFLPRHA